MNVVSLNRGTVSKVVPKVIEDWYAAFGSDWIEWGPSIQITQKMIDAYVAALELKNPLHGQGGPFAKALAPGFLALGLAERLVPPRMLDTPAEYAMLMKHVDCHWVRGVSADSWVKMRCQKTGILAADEVGTTAGFFFDIAFDTDVTAIHGSVDLKFIW